MALMNRYERHMHEKNTPGFFLSRIDRMQRNGLCTRDELPYCIHLALTLQRARNKSAGDYGELARHLDRVFKLWSDWYRSGLPSYWRGTNKPSSNFSKRVYRGSINEILDYKGSK